MCIRITQFSGPPLEATLRQHRKKSQWCARDLGYSMLLVEAPEDWRAAVLHAGSVRLENVDFKVSPSMDEGDRLKSVWLNVRGFPMKLWQYHEFEKLVEDFEVLLNVNNRTRGLYVLRLGSELEFVISLPFLGVGYCTAM